MRTHHLILSALLCFGVFPIAARAQSPEIQHLYWTVWRSSQRAELAALPKPPQPPAGPGLAVDRFVRADWARHKVQPPSIVNDRTFVRRVYLDVIGLLPTPEQLERFERDPSPDKRAKLVDALLADNQDYAEHWMSFWNDLLRNDEQTNIDGLRKPITPWLFVSLRDNKPLDLFVAELLNPGPNGPDRLAGVPGVVAQVRLLPQQLHQRVEAGPGVRPGELLLSAESGDAPLRQ